MAGGWSCVPQSDNAEPTHLYSLQGQRGPEAQRVLWAGAGWPWGARRVLCTQEHQEAPRYVSPGARSPVSLRVSLPGVVARASCWLSAAPWAPRSPQNVQP